MVFIGKAFTRPRSRRKDLLAFVLISITLLLTYEAYKARLIRGLPDLVLNSAHKSTFQFSHVYVLSGSTSRLDYIRPVLDRVNLEYEVFPGPAPDDRRVQEIWDAIESWKLTTTETRKIQQVPVKQLRGRLGCTVGHVAMWKDMVAHNYSTALFLEDDIDVRINIEALLEESLKAIPDNWQALYPGYCSTRWTATGNGTAPTMANGKIWSRLSRAACTHSYVLKQGTAQMLVNRTEFSYPPNMQTPVDVHLAHMISDGVIANVYGYIPPLTQERPRSVSNPSLVSFINFTYDSNGLHRGDQYLDRLPKDTSAAYQAGVSYWHD